MSGPAPTPPPLDDPPPRAPWEVPRPDGWSSIFRGVGVGTLGFTLNVLVALTALRIASYALHLGRRHHLTGLRAALHAGAWIAVVIIAVSLLVYVWRRLGGMAMLLAMLTDHGRLARLRARPPVWLDAPPPSPALRVAHLSDLHVAETERVRLIESPVPCGNAALARLLASPALDDAELVLITGDITDRGTAASWRAFLDALDARGLADRTLLVPGNHDINLVEMVAHAARGETGWARQVLRTDRFGIVHLANLLKFGDAFARTLGGREGWVMWSRAWGPMPRPASDPATDLSSSRARPLHPEAVPFRIAWPIVSARTRALIESLPDRPAPSVGLFVSFDDLRAFRAYERTIDAARRALLHLFPVAVPVPGRDAIVFVLNTAARTSRHLASNALGWVGRDQVTRLELLGRSFPQRLRLVTLHHHLVRRGEELAQTLVARVFARFAVLADAWRVTRFCRAFAVRAVFNGHRHLSYQARLPGGCVLLAAPSSTLGDELAGDPRPQLERYDFAAEIEAPTVGIHRAVHRPIARD